MLEKKNRKQRAFPRFQQPSRTQHIKRKTKGQRWFLSPNRSALTTIPRKGAIQTSCRMGFTQQNSLHKQLKERCVLAHSVRVFGHHSMGRCSGKVHRREAGRQRVTIGLGTRHKLQEYASRALLLAKPYSIKCSECPQNGTTNWGSHSVQRSLWETVQIQTIASCACPKGLWTTHNATFWSVSLLLY